MKIIQSLLMGALALCFAGRASFAQDVPDRETLEALEAQFSIEQLQAMFASLGCANPYCPPMFVVATDGGTLAQIIKNTRDTVDYTKEWFDLMDHTQPEDANTFNVLLKKVNTTTNGTSGAFENFKSARLEAQEQKLRKAPLQEVLVIRKEAANRAQMVRLELLDDQTCRDANVREQVGAGVGRPGVVGAVGMKKHGDTTRAGRTAVGVIRRLEEIQEEATKSIPFGLAASAGTLTIDQIEAQSAFLSMVQNPRPPTPPEDIPAELKGRLSAAEYSTLFKVWESLQLYLIRPALRELEMAAPSIVPVQGLLEDFRSKVVRSSGPPQTIEISGGRSVIVDEFRSDIIPKPIGAGGSLGVSERDYLRMMVYRLYADPDIDKRIQGSPDSWVQKELMMQQAVKSRLLSEVMFVLQNRATTQSFETALHLNQKNNKKLELIRDNLSGSN